MIRQLSIVTAALMALAQFERLALARPDADASEIARCERLIRNPAGRLFTGRGARMRVIEPWLTYLDEYEQALQGIKMSWNSTVRPMAERTAPDTPSGQMLAALAKVDVQRELESVTPELRGRLGQLRRKTEDISDDIGHVGTLVAVGALVLRTAAVAAVVAAVSVTLYYSGYQILDFARSISSRVGRWKRRSPREASVSGASLPEVSDLESVIRKARSGSVDIRSGTLLSPAEASAAIRLWLELLGAGHRDSEAAATFESGNERRIEPSGVVIVVGGPIVRARYPSAWNFHADLARDAKGWRVFAGGEGALRAEESESTGLLSVGWRSRTSEPNLILACGFRDTGGVKAVQRLIHAFRDSESNLAEGMGKQACGGRPIRVKLQPGDPRWVTVD